MSGSAGRVGEAVLFLLKRKPGLQNSGYTAFTFTGLAHSYQLLWKICCLHLQGRIVLSVPRASGWQNTTSGNRRPDRPCRSLVPVPTQLSRLRKFDVYAFRRVRKNCEKRPLASSRLGVPPSVRPHGTTRLPLDGFSWNLTHIFSSTTFFPENCARG